MRLVLQEAAASKGKGRAVGAAADKGQGKARAAAPAQAAEQPKEAARCAAVLSHTRFALQTGKLLRACTLL